MATVAFLWILVLGKFVSTIPTVDRYLTELPLHTEWDLQMMSDQTYSSAPPSASAYVYQIEDPSANYIFSASDYKPREHDNRQPATKPKFAYRSSIDSDQLFGSSLETRTPLFAPSAYFHFLGTASSDVSPYYGGNILHTFYQKPVYIVNNDGLNLYDIGPGNVYESYVVLRPAPVIYGFPKLDHRHPQVPTTKKPPVGHATVVETNLTKINIDPITEPKTARKVPKKLPSGGSAESAIIHKRRAYSKNPYGIIYHKISTDAYYL